MEFPNLRAAGKKIGAAITNPMEAARGLRGMLPGGAQAPAAPAAPAAAAETPLPKIDPTMAERATATMRAPKPPGIPVLTDVIQEGVGPVNRPPAIPTLTDVIEPGTVKPPGFTPAAGQANPSMRGGMSPERLAYNAEQAARTGPPAPVGGAARSLPSLRAPNLAGAGRAVLNNVPSKMGTLGGGLTAAASFAPHWDAFSDDSTLDAGQKSKLLLRDTARAVGGVVGGVVGGAVGSVAGPVGTVAGGAGGGYAGFEGVDALGGGLRRGLNAVNEKLGGSPNYITSTDEDLAADAARRAKPAAAVTGVLPTAAAATAPAAGAPAAPQTPADIAAFNARMTEVGASGVGMRAGLTPDSRVLYGTSAGADKQAITDARMAQRTADVRAQDASANAGQSERFAQLASDERADAISRRAFDSGTFDADIAAAKASGSAGRIAQAYGAKEAAQRAFSGEKQADTQAFTSMRNTDVQAGVQQAQSNVALAVAQRKATTDEREFGLKAAQFGLDNKKFGQTQDEHEDDVNRRQGEKVIERVAGMVKPSGDPVRDQAKVAQYKQALPTYVAQIKAQLQEHLKANPDDKTAASALEGFERRGVAHLGDEDLDHFMRGMEFNELAQSTHSAKYNPIGGTATNRPGPAMSLRRDSRITGDVYVDDSGAEVPARFIDSDGSFIMRPPNVRFNSLKDRK